MQFLFTAQISILILRLSLGVVLLAHSIYLKLMVFTLAGTASYFVSIGLPKYIAYLTFAVEALAGFALLVGFQSRVFLLAVIPVLIGATWAHSHNGWLFSNSGGGWEYPLILTVMAIAQLGLGDGKFSLSNYLQTKYLQTKHQQTKVKNRALKGDS